MMRPPSQPPPRAGTAGLEPRGAVIDNGRMQAQRCARRRLDPAAVEEKVPRGSHHPTGRQAGTQQHRRQRDPQPLHNERAVGRGLVRACC